MVGWHHQLNEHECEQTLGDSEGQGNLACFSSLGCKGSDTTEQLNNINIHLKFFLFYLWFFFLISDSSLCLQYLASVNNSFSHSVNHIFNKYWQLFFKCLWCRAEQYSREMQHALPKLRVYNSSSPALILGPCNTLKVEDCKRLLIMWVTVVGIYYIRD